MAQAKVVELFIQELEKVSVPTLIGSSATGDILDVTFNTSTVAEQFSKGIEELMKPLRRDGTLAIEINDFERKTHITKIVQKAIQNIRTTKEVRGDRKTFQVPLFTAAGYIGPGTGKGSYIVRGGGTSRITFRFVSVGKGAGTGANDTRIRAIVKALRDQIYNTWLNEAGGPVQLFGNLPRRGSKADELTDVTQIGHELSTTRGALALQILKKSSPSFKGLPYNFTLFDVAEQIQKNINVDVDRNYVKNKIGNFEFRYKINTQIMENFTGSEDSDFSKLKEREIKKAVNDLFMKSKSLGTNLLNSSGSKKPKDTAIEDTILTLLGPLTKKGKPDKRFKANKRFKKLSDSFNVKKGKKAKPLTGVGSITLAAISDRAGAERPEKSKREGTQTLQALKTKINRKLPAQIRRNMGRPGVLTNRSGTFSNSPQLLNIRETKTGLTGDYTYMKTGGGTPPRSGQSGVYQTFENSGRWGGKYNPKDLITKSIRDLAKQETAQRFVQLRRQ